MAGSSATLHESPEALGSEAIDRHRAIVSVMEELEAIDWYDQRAIASGDDELRAVLEHNRDDEKEHAAMALEWLRRRDPSLDVQLRKYLFTEGSIIGRAFTVFWPVNRATWLSVPKGFNAIPDPQS